MPLTHEIVPVASYMLAWIEINKIFSTELPVVVASYMLAWIEIVRKPSVCSELRSQAICLRGLKCVLGVKNRKFAEVASYMLAWIEIFQASNLNCNGVRRKLYACVD